MTPLDVLTPRALAAWAGTDRLSALPFRLPPGPYATHAARMFALFVGGETVALDLDSPLLERVPNGVRARYSVLPHGRSLLVCDRLDCERGVDAVSWPDDSSYHLALSIPAGRRASWLDIATGSAFAPLLRPELAERVVGTDLNPHAIDLARLGAELSGTAIDLHVADIADGVGGRFELVTCNAPIPADVGPLWRATADRTFFPRLFASIPRLLAPGGMFVLHAALADVRGIVETLPGERVIVRYVPDGGRAFGILWWRPDAASRHVEAFRPLASDRPHLTDADRLAALGA